MWSQVCLCGLFETISSYEMGKQRGSYGVFMPLCLIAIKLLTEKKQFTGHEVFHSYLQVSLQSV
jgi:hypothetical protein